MAKADNQITVIRSAITTLLDNVYANANRALTLAEGPGSTDQERMTFYNTFLATASGYDIDEDDFIAAMTKLRELITWLENPVNYVPLNKMRL